MSIANGFIKSKRFRTLSDLTHKLESLWTAADTVEYTDADLSGVSVANTRPVSILDEEDFNDLTTSEKNNGYIYYVYSTDATTGKTTSYIYTKGITYGVGDPSVELTWAEYQALPSTKETDGITYYITDRDPSESISIGAENVTYGNTTVDEVLDDILDGGGGHTIENDAGTDMTQRDNLQFSGAYVTDDSTNDRTKVDVVRSMTKAQYDALSAAEKVGIINVTDDNTVLDAEMVSYNNGTVDGALDDINNPTFTEASTRANIASGESFSTILGKIKKFFTDLKTVAFTGAYSDLSGQPDLTNVAYKNVNNQFSANQTIDTQTTFSLLSLGNNKAYSEEGKSTAAIRLYGTGTYRSDIHPIGSLTANRDVYLPDASGTIALTSDLENNGTIVRKGAGSGTTITITFDESGAGANALIFGRFGYDSAALGMGIISHPTTNTAYILCFGDQTATVSCTGDAVTVNFPQTYANVTAVSAAKITIS